VIRFVFIKLVHIVKQVSLGILSIGNPTTLPPTKCSAYSR
jgi:hypothetical protein